MSAQVSDGRVFSVAIRTIVAMTSCGCVVEQFVEVDVWSDAAHPIWKGPTSSWSLCDNGGGVAGAHEVGESCGGRTADQAMRGGQASSETLL